MFLVPYCSCLCPIHWNPVLSWEWRRSWSSTDRLCSNYIWVINKFIAYQPAPYIRGLTVCLFCIKSIRLDGPEDRHLRNSSFGGHVTAVTWPRSRFTGYPWPRPPGVWLGGPGCKPGHSRRSLRSSPHLTASGLIPVMINKKLAIQVENVWFTSKHECPMKTSFVTHVFVKYEPCPYNISDDQVWVKQ